MFVPTKVDPTSIIPQTLTAQPYNPTPATADAVLVPADSEAGRTGLIVNNQGTGALYLNYGTAASATDATVTIPAGGYWEMPQPIYIGAIHGLWASTGGSCTITELF